jgi:hypothetical protein
MNGRNLIAAAWVAAGSLLAQSPDLLVADFEGTNYGAWKVTGEAFGRIRCRSRVFWARVW